MDDSFAAWFYGGRLAAQGTDMAQERLEHIDALRGAAAVAVLCDHVFQQFYAHALGSLGDRFFEWLGSWGVSLFFVLSGFCIHYPTARKRRADPLYVPQKGEFLRRRALRIYPPYVAALVAAVGAGLFVQTNLIDGAHSPADITLHLLELHTLLPDTSESINGVFWTIALECHFYLLYILLFSAHRFNLKTLAALLIVGLAAYGLPSTLLSSGNPWRVVGQRLFIVSFWQWYLGALIAAVYVAFPEHLPRSVPGFLVVSAASLALGFIDPTVAGLHLVFWIAPPLLALLVVFAVRLPSSPPPLPAIGLISYSLYLLHPITIALAVYFIAVPAIAAPAAMVLSLALAALSYRLIELPILKYRRGHAGLNTPPIHEAAS